MLQPLNQQKMYKLLSQLIPKVIMFLLVVMLNVNLVIELMVVTVTHVLEVSTELKTLLSVNVNWDITNLHNNPIV